MKSEPTRVVDVFPEWYGALCPMISTGSTGDA